MTIRYDPFRPPDRDDPYPTWARARAEAPVFFSEAQQAWIVTRYDDISEAVRDTARFISADVVRPLTPPPEVQAVLQQGYAYEEMRPLVATDPPRHTRLRKFANAAFTPKRVVAMEPRIRSLARELIHVMAPAGEGDLIESFAYPLPLRVVMALMGVPETDQETVHRWSQDKVALQWGGDMDLAEHVSHAQGFVEFQRYFASLIDERRRIPGGDIVSAMVAARLEGEKPLGTPELVGQMMGLITAGHETTTNLIAHAVILLLRHSDQWDALLGDASLASATVEEVLRMDSPVMGMMRTATMDAELGGARIPAGARVQLMFASANRDAGYFADPNHFDIRRSDAGRHVAFGHGNHFCLGAGLARLEGRIAIELLASQLPTLCLDPDPISYRPNAAFRGPVSLHVSWDPRSYIDSSDH